MTEVSPSGVFTLIFLIVCAPLFHAVKHYYKVYNKRGIVPIEKINDYKTKAEVPSDFLVVKEGDVAISPLEEMLQDQPEGPKHEYKSTEYVFALIGYAIGIGNVWRFPYVIAQNGGAAALFAYIVCAVLVAVPIFLYEMIAGQHVRLSTIRCYEAIRPRWKSLGVAASAMLFLILSYYGMVVGYTFPYLWNSLQHPLPWMEPGAQRFWFQNVLNRDTNHSGPGGIQGQLAFSLLLFWGIVFWCVSFGKKILSKITFVTVLLPVVLMLILVCRTVFLAGAWDGIRFYIWKFEVSELLNIRVWAAACSQILFSLSPGFGTAITFSSHTKPKEDVYRACMIVVIANSAFSIIGGFAIFAMVGHLAHLNRVNVFQVAQESGTGLAFITLAEAMPYFGPLANVMSVLFFFMLFLLGLDSAYALLTTIVCYVEDYMEEQRYPKRPTWHITGVCVATLYVMGLLFATRNGNAILDVVDHFVGSIFLLFVVCAESIMFIKDFGWARMEYALAKATFGNLATPRGRTLLPQWLCHIDFHWTVPIISGSLGLYLVVDNAMEPYGNYPLGLVIWGWALLIVLVSIIPVTLWKQDPGTLPEYSMADIAHDEDDAMKDMSAYREIETPVISITPALRTSSAPC
jgi:SNF family Na+-dependent transporter